MKSISLAPQRVRGSVSVGKDINQFCHGLLLPLLHWFVGGLSAGDPILEKEGGGGNLKERKIKAVNIVNIESTPASKQMLTSLTLRAHHHEK